ncbi:MAG: hypothetical protein ACPGTO_11715 [Polaribacter sp.]
MMKNATVILNTTPLPDRFYAIYDIVNPDKREKTMFQQIRSRLLPHKSTFHWDCKCDEIAYLAWNNKSLNFHADLKQLTARGGYLKFGIGLEKYSNSKKCFDLWINKSIYWKTEYLENLNTLSKKVIGKDVNLLNTEEILLLIAWHDMLNRGINEAPKVQERFKILKTQYEGKAST